MEGRRAGLMGHREGARIRRGPPTGLFMNIDLSVRNCSKRFGEFEAVKSISFDIPKGHFFSILGPSGCGKTTLLRMIAGFTEPSSGEILIGGRNMGNIPPNKRPVSLVFQHLALFPMMSVEKNIAFGLQQRGEPRKTIASRVEGILETVGLPEFGKKQIQQLSGGQKQRVAIARCLVLEPTVLLLDEPLGALDLKLREHMKIELKKLQAKVGTTFLYITHDQSEALVMSDRVAIMNEGRIEQLDTPIDCYRNPNSAFVAGFLGESNRWDGRITRVDGTSATVDIPEGLSFQCLLREGANIGDKVTMFVRSEAISVETGDHGHNRLDTEVVSNLFDGNSDRVLVKCLQDSKEVMVSLSTGDMREPLQKGQKVVLSWPREAGMCFLAEEA